MKRQVFNPYLPSYEYVPDGEPHVFGERVYIYGSHDRFNGKRFCEENYVCWSAPVQDLTDWKFEGEIYRKEQDEYVADAKIVDYLLQMCKEVQMGDIISFMLLIFRV